MQNTLEMPAVAPAPSASLRVQCFADGADLAQMRALAADPTISGFTTNPTLMHQAGITDYEQFARQVLTAIPDRPISFEVFTDDFPEMVRQARRIRSWGSNVNVKIPVTNTRGQFAGSVIRELSAEGISVNVTAIMTTQQIAAVMDCLEAGAASFLSVFAGRIADTGLDPLPIIRDAVALASQRPNTFVIWASPRELLNLVQADQAGCHIITMTPDLLRKRQLIGRDLNDYSLATVRMFYDDARAAGFQL